jgi:hypothetical protein
MRASFAKGKIMKETDASCSNSLHQALYSGRLDIVRSQLKINPDAVNERNRKGNTLLLPLTLGNGLVDFSLEILRDFKPNVNAVNLSGRTPLMVAARFMPDLVQELLQHGAMTTISATSNSKKTVADHASEGNYTRLAARLTQLSLEADQVARDETILHDSRHELCSVCDERVKLHDNLWHLRQRVARGQETNPLVVEFIQSDLSKLLAQRAFHTLTSMNSFSKEVTESMACMHVLRKTKLGSSFHVVDLCSGKSLNTALCVLEFQSRVVVTAVDRLAPELLPHYENYPNVHYLQADILVQDFFSRLRSHIKSINLPTIILGVHLCGRLSVTAIRLAHVSPLVRNIMLVPCCMPKRRYSHEFPPGLVGSGQFHAWVAHLEMEMAKHATHIDTICNPNIRSPKNTMLLMDVDHSKCCCDSASDDDVVEV